MRARLLTLALALAACHAKSRSSTPIPGDRGPALTVEVLNASGRAGDARRATRLLRGAGLDVVYFGNATDGNLDSTRIIVRRGTRAAGDKVREALGQGTVAVQLDATKLLDVSVLLGADFTGPRGALDFHP